MTHAYTKEIESCPRYSTTIRNIQDVARYFHYYLVSQVAAKPISFDALDSGNEVSYKGNKLIVLESAME